MCPALCPPYSRGGCLVPLAAMLATGALLTAGGVKAVAACRNSAKPSKSLVASSDTFVRSAKSGIKTASKSNLWTNIIDSVTHGVKSSAKNLPPKLMKCVR